MKLSKQHSNYVSEYGRFLQQLKQERPAIEEEQRAGRALLWDRQPVTLEEQARDKASRIRQQPYVYQNKS